jgi:hypothetical protein
LSAGQPSLVGFSTGTVRVGVTDTTPAPADTAPLPGTGTHHAVSGPRPLIPLAPKSTPCVVPSGRSVAFGPCRVKYSSGVDVNPWVLVDPQFSLGVKIQAEEYCLVAQRILVAASLGACGSWHSQDEQQTGPRSC